MNNTTNQLTTNHLGAIQVTREERIAKAEAEAEQAWAEEQAAFEARYRQIVKTER